MVMAKTTAIRFASIISKEGERRSITIPKSILNDIDDELVNGNKQIIVTIEPI